MATYGQCTAINQVAQSESGCGDALMGRVGLIYSPKPRMGR
jgi:hypothetical protein